MISIYILVNPINEQVFYVGATMYPEQRLMQHCRNSYSSQFKYETIEEIKESGLLPEMVVVEESVSREQKPFPWLADMGT